MEGRYGLLLLTDQQAENCWKVRIAGQDRLLITSADLFSDGSRITLRSLGKREFRFSLFPGLGSGQRLVASSALRTTAFRNGLQEYTAQLPPANASLTLRPSSARRDRATRPNGSCCIVAPA